MRPARWSLRMRDRQSFKTYKGKAMAVVRSDYRAGEAVLTVKAETLEEETVKLVCI